MSKTTTPYVFCTNALLWLDIEQKIYYGYSRHMFSFLLRDVAADIAMDLERNTRIK
jgi:hypothetical protein